MVSGNKNDVGRALERGVTTTQTQLKLEDAATQMKLAIENSESETVFRSCINAYISAARSITMVMEKESKDFDPRLLDWYKREIQPFGAAPFFKFFNEQRVFSIHRGVVEPKRQEWAVESATAVSMEGQRDPRYSFTVVADAMPAGKDDIVTVHADGRMNSWAFDEFKSVWPNHSGNVLSLCEMHFLSFKRLVIEWLKERERIGQIAQR
jgi:hypothetical protein